MSETAEQADGKLTRDELVTLVAFRAALGQGNYYFVRSSTGKPIREGDFVYSLKGRSELVVPGNPDFDDIFGVVAEIVQNVTTDDGRRYFQCRVIATGGLFR